MKSEFLYPNLSKYPKNLTNMLFSLKPPSSTIVRGQISLISKISLHLYFIFKYRPLAIVNNERLETMIASGAANASLLSQNKFHSKCNQLMIRRGDLATEYLSVFSQII